MSAPPQQIAFWLPPPITAHEAAAIIGKLGGRARAERARIPIRKTAQQIREELHLPPDPRLT
jgi:hypothetical protein